MVKKKFAQLMLLSVAFLLISSSPKVKLEGIWIFAYKLSNEVKYADPTQTKMVLDFEGDSVNVISFADVASDELGRLQMKRVPYKIKRNGSKIILFGKKVERDNSKNLLIFKDKDGYEVRYERLDPKYKMNGALLNNFAGSYVMKSGAHQDSIHFINDSTLIYTGMNNSVYPFKKWNIINYKGFQFLNIQDELTPLFLIKSSSEYKYQLLYVGRLDKELLLLPTNTSIERKNFVGKWRESQSTLKPPPYPGLEEIDMYYEMLFDLDSVIIKVKGRSQKLKWELTGDGKKVYFPDKLFKEDGFWQLFQLTDSTIRLGRSRANGLDDEIVDLIKVQN